MTISQFKSMSRPLYKQQNRKQQTEVAPAFLFNVVHESKVHSDPNSVFVSTYPLPIADCAVHSSQFYPLGCVLGIEHQW